MTSAVLWVRYKKSPGFSLSDDALGIFAFWNEWDSPFLLVNQHELDMIGAQSHAHGRFMHNVIDWERYYVMRYGPYRDIIQKSYQKIVNYAIYFFAPDIAFTVQVC